MTDPESGLTLTNTFPVGSLNSGNFNRGSPCVLAGDVTFPAAVDVTGDWVLFELGGSGIGASIIYESTTGKVYARYGEGSSSVLSPSSSCVQVEFDYSVVAGQTGTLCWEISNSTQPDDLRVWFNDVLISGPTNGGSAGAWAGSEAGGWGTYTSSIPGGSDNSGALLTDYTGGSIDSGLRYYENQLSSWTAGGGGSAVTGTLAAQESGSDSAAISAAVIVSGTAAAQESGSDSAAASGTVLVSGILSVAESGQDSASLSGRAAISGSISAQDANDEAAISGAVGVAGSAAVAEAGYDTAAISGVVASEHIVRIHFTCAPLTRSFSASEIHGRSMVASQLQRQFTADAI